MSSISKNVKSDELIDNNLRRLLLAVPAAVGTSLLPACGGGGVDELLNSNAAGVTSLPAIDPSDESGVLLSSKQVELAKRKLADQLALDPQVDFNPKHVSPIDWAKLNEFKIWYADKYINKYIAFKARLMAVYHIATDGGTVNGNIYLPELANDPFLKTHIDYYKKFPGRISADYKSLQGFYQKHYMETLRNYHYNNNIPAAGALSYGSKFDIMKNFVISILNSEEKINLLKQHHPREFIRVRVFAKMVFSHNEFLKLNANIVSAETAHDRRLKVSAIGATDDRIETKNMTYIYQKEGEIRFNINARYFLRGTKRMPVENIDFEYKSPNFWLEESGLLAIRNHLELVANEDNILSDPTDLIEFTNTTSTGEKFTKIVYNLTPNVLESIRKIVDKEHSQNGDFYVIDNGVKVPIPQDHTKDVLISLTRELTEATGHVYSAYVMAMEVIQAFNLFNVGVIRGLLYLEKFNLDTMREVCINWENQPFFINLLKSHSKADYLLIHGLMVALLGGVLSSAVMNLIHAGGTFKAIDEANKTNQSPSRDMLDRYTAAEYASAAGQFVTTISSLWGLGLLSNVIRDTTLTGDNLKLYKSYVPALFAFTDITSGYMGLILSFAKIRRREHFTAADALDLSASFIRAMGGLYFVLTRTGNSPYGRAQAALYGRRSLGINSVFAVVAGLVSMAAGVMKARAI